MRYLFVPTITLAFVLAAGCGDDDGSECTGDSDCPANSICTPAGVCAPDPGARTCAADIDCGSDAGLDDHLICNVSTGRCTAPVVDRCPEQELIDRVCAVSRRESFCVENIFVNCAEGASECTECEDGCTADGCEAPRDAGPDVRDMAPPDEDTGPPDEDTGPRDMGPPDLGPPAPECGNDTIEAGEECDPPRPAACGGLRGCSDSCRFVDRVPTCGDGCVDPLEECGETMSGGCDVGAVCRGCQCAIPSCGDGFGDTGEECGEPGLAACADDEVCTSGCVCGPPVCGNGDAEPGETCGEPGLACPAGQSCDACICQAAPSCGDGTADMGEQCGEPMLEACETTEECVNCLCTVLCGNGRNDAGETCGEMGLACAAGQTCRNCRCIDPCGNGVVDPGEQCDPMDPGAGAPPGTPTCANSVYCSPRCLIEARPRVCGNGCIDATEECGEPGLSGSCPGGPCESCQCPDLCGNGVVDGAAGEECESTEDCFIGVGGDCPPCGRFCGAQPYCDQCQCELSTCGDGILEGDEQCEFNPASQCSEFGCGLGFGCNAFCGCEPLSRCFDGIILETPGGNEGDDTCDFNSPLPNNGCFDNEFCVEHEGEIDIVCHCHSNEG